MTQEIFARADDEKLAAVSEAQAARFRNVFETAGYSQESLLDSLGAVELRSRAGRNLPRLLRATASGKPQHVLYRLFMLGVPAPIREAREAMAPVPIEEWVEAGLLESDNDSVRALLTILHFEGLLLASDSPELLERGTASDFVSGVTNSSASLLAFAAIRPCKRALDLGTGCGLQAFAAARKCESVWATDINPRAIRFAKFNARLNGISNVEFHCGSAFEPIAAQKFDLILSNPPCVIGMNNRYAFRDSGMDLDNFCRKLISDAPAHLVEGGIFQCTAQWPNVPGQDWKERVSGWVAESGCDALILRNSTKSVAAHAEENVLETDVLDQEAWPILFNDQMDYFERMGIESISDGLIALRRRCGSVTNWTRFEDLPSRGFEYFGGTVLTAFQVRDLLETLSDGEILQRSLLVAPETEFQSGYVWNGKAWNPGNFVLRQKTDFRFQAVIDLHVAGVIRRCDGTAPLQRILDEMAAGLGVDAAKIIPGCVGVVRGMIERGFLLLSA